MVENLTLPGDSDEIILTRLAVGYLALRVGSPDRAYGVHVTVSSTLDHVAAEEFVSLTTFRRDGSPVAVPVWIARNGDALVVTTPAGTGKVKRLRRDPRVELRACGRRGQVREGAEPVAGLAEVVPPEPLIWRRCSGSTACSTGSARWSSACAPAAGTGDPPDPAGPAGAVTPGSHAGSGRVLGAVDVVGVAGFEPTAPRSQSECATKLRHTPSGGV